MDDSDDDGDDVKMTEKVVDPQGRSLSREAFAERLEGFGQDKIVLSGAPRVVQGKEEMFSKIFAKNLSDHSIGTFRLLCREVGESFEALLSDNKGSLLGSLVSVCKKRSRFVKNRLTTAVGGCSRAQFHYYH